LANRPPKLRWAVFGIIALLALALRLPDLGVRPMHTDEAVNGYITGQLLAGGDYLYDPRDRHGPALYLAALPICELAGASNLESLTETAVRLTPVIFGSLTLLLFVPLVPRIGFAAATVAALLMALGPLAVYYSRYFIHESLFVAGTLAFLLSGWRILELQTLRAALACGASAAFMLCCKETALLHFAAFGLPLAWWWIQRRKDPDARRFRLLLRCGAVFLAAFLLIVVAMYTWGGQHWQGPLDLLRSIPRFAARAGGEGHEKPFSYYILLIGNSWAGWAVMLLAVSAFWKPSRMNHDSAKSEPDPRHRHPRLFLEMLGIYTAGIVLLYSLIPYKNPWLALNLWMPLTLLAGAGLGRFWTQRPLNRVGCGLMIAAILSGLGMNTWKWVYAKPADERNPYAYAHTVEDLLGLPSRVTQLLQGDSPETQVSVAVVADDPWPLPWYLRRIPKVGYYPSNQPAPEARIYITSLEAAERMQEQLKDRQPEFFGVRPEVLILVWSRSRTEVP
jgi:uncharacterized protein (TIGR03663 family)